MSDGERDEIREYKEQLRPYLLDAEEGNYAELIEVLRDPESDLDMRDRELIAEIIEKRAKKPSKGRPKGWRKRNDEINAVRRFMLHWGLWDSRAAALNWASKEFDKDESTIEGWIRTVKKDEPQLYELFDWLAFGREKGLPPPEIE